MRDIKNHIEQSYETYVQENGKNPSVARVQIQWKDDGNTCEVNIYIDGCGTLEGTDDDIFYYCDSVEDLISLSEDGVEDFIVTDFYYFFEYENE